MQKQGKIFQITGKDIFFVLPFSFKGYIHYRDCNYFSKMKATFAHFVWHTPYTPPYPTQIPTLGPTKIMPVLSVANPIYYVLYKEKNCHVYLSSICLTFSLNLIGFFSLLQLGDILNCSSRVFFVKNAPKIVLQKILKIFICIEDVTKVLKPWSFPEADEKYLKYLTSLRLSS